MFLKYIKFEMPLYLHLLFYCIRLFSLVRCVANTVVTLAMSSIINLHFSLVVLLITLMSGDVSENPGLSSYSSTNNISMSVLHCNIRSIHKKFEFIKETLSDFNIHVLCFTEMHLHYNVSNEALFIKGFQYPPFRKRGVWIIRLGSKFRGVSLDRNKTEGRLYFTL